MYKADTIKNFYSEAVRKTKTFDKIGRVKKVVGLVLESEGPKAPIGEICNIRNRKGQVFAQSEIVGFKDNRILSMVLGDITDIEPGTEIVSTGRMLTIKILLN